MRVRVLAMKKMNKRITIKSVDSNFEREPLRQPFGFKGGYITELWQAASVLEAESGIKKIGLGTQSVLWSDAAVFAAHTPVGGNALMYAMTEYALQAVKGVAFTNPIELQDGILDEVYQFGKKITNNEQLRKTFVLNALVSLDFAAWMVYAEENGFTTFDDMIPAEYWPAFPCRHLRVASIPLISYTSLPSEIEEMADAGYYIVKIKLGHPGSQDEMLSKDMEWISVIHRAIGSYTTPHTTSGKLLYFLDANGRYQKKDTLLRLIEHLKAINAFEQVAVIEEPFHEGANIDVRDIPIRIAADESAHTDQDLLKLIQQGYTAVALKPVAKTLSMTMKMAKVAAENNIPCFCADLTVNAVLVDWNKNVAARLAPLPGMKTGLLETNGRQNYKNWQEMETYHPYPVAKWRTEKGGVFHLDKNFYQKSGGVLAESPHYRNMFQKDLNR